MVGHGEVKAKQPQHAAGERLDPAEGEVENEPQRQHQPDRNVRVERLPTGRGPLRRSPSRDGCLVYPQREVAAPLQPGFVGRPVAHPIAALWNVVAAGGVAFERHSGTVAGRMPASQSPQVPAGSLHQRPR